MIINLLIIEFSVSLTIKLSKCIHFLIFSLTLSCNSYYLLIPSYFIISSNRFWEIMSCFALSLNESKTLNKSYSWTLISLNLKRKNSEVLSFNLYLKWIKRVSPVILFLKFSIHYRWLLIFLCANFVEVPLRAVKNNCWKYSCLIPKGTSFKFSSIVFISW